ncbi:hypothetical protein HB780_16400 [Rhizobium lusitanum]|uniref:hypothetical protein n=1 Tax=Rhizobium lusitanum TaxID=293958 RepID=UPI00161BC148|nr:hypothetical protein [Rhizobium lusitanum]QND47289.1 hypothetical protein HB780_16400 [Rhizobium lusitanum]
MAITLLAGGNVKCGDIVLPEQIKNKRRPFLSKREKLSRILYFAIFYAFCFAVVAIFDTEWVTITLGCLVVGIGIGELNGLSFLSLFSRHRNEKDQ